MVEYNIDARPCCGHYHEWKFTITIFTSILWRVNINLCYAVQTTDYSSQIHNIERFHWLGTSLESILCYNQGCFCPRTFFENIGLNSLLWNSFVSCLQSQLRNSADVFQVLWCLGCGLTSCPLYVGPYHGTYMLNMMFCKLDRVQNRFSLSCY